MSVNLLHFTQEASRQGVTVSKAQHRGNRIRLHCCCVGHASQLAAHFAKGKYITRIQQRGTVLILTLANWV